MLAGKGIAQGKTTSTIGDGKPVSACDRALVWGVPLCEIVLAMETDRALKFNRLMHYFGALVKCGAMAAIVMTGAGKNMCFNE